MHFVISGSAGAWLGQMAVRAAGVVKRIVAIKVADNNGGENQQREKRQRNPNEPSCFTKRHTS